MEAVKKTVEATTAEFRPSTGSHVEIIPINMEAYLSFQVSYHLDY
jgi:hypothetical protein